MNSENKIIVLDRDGVINIDSPDYIKTPEEWNPLPGSIEAIAKLTGSGYRIFIATNQSGIGRGLYTEATYREIEQKMLAMIEDGGGKIEGIFYCPHTPDDRCACRKPQPGLLYEIEKAIQRSLENVVFVGDSRRDLDAAETVGAKGVLVLTGNGRKTLEGLDEDHGFDVYDDLLGVTEALCTDT